MHMITVSRWMMDAVTNFINKMKIRIAKTCYWQSACHILLATSFLIRGPGDNLQEIEVKAQSKQARFTDRVRKEATFTYEKLLFLQKMRVYLHPARNSVNQSLARW